MNISTTPLRMILNIKQEGLKRNKRIVADGHVINYSLYASYSPVVKTRSIRLLETVAMNEDLSFMIGDIGKALSTP